MSAYLNRIATAVPDHDVHMPFVEFADNMLEDSRLKNLFHRMAQRSGITSRFSVLNPHETRSEFDIDANKFYTRGSFPDTARRMQVYEEQAPRLAYKTLDKLSLSDEERRRITHVVVTSCTGLYAPGLDFEIMHHLGLDPGVERTVIGFMGCFAAVNGLKLARHVVRSEPHAAVLMVNLELCTLHLQETQELEQVLSFLVFADGCSAALITSDEKGFALDSFRSVLLPETRDLITWKIRGSGFDMMLSGRVPGEIGKGLRTCADSISTTALEEIALWAVHPGGKSVLDAVEQGLALQGNALEASRQTLCRYGNMSSATVMFVLERLLRDARSGQKGCGMSFGPGMTAETFTFHAA